MSFPVLEVGFGLDFLEESVRREKDIRLVLELRMEKHRGKEVQESLRQLNKVDHISMGGQLTTSGRTENPLERQHCVERRRVLTPCYNN